MGTNEIIEKLEKMRKKKNKMGCSVLLLLFLSIPIDFVISIFVGGIGSIIAFAIMMVVFVLVFVRIGKITNEYKRLYKERGTIVQIVGIKIRCSM